MCPGAELQVGACGLPSTCPGRVSFPLGHGSPPGIFPEIQGTLQFFKEQNRPDHLFFSFLIFSSFRLPFSGSFLRLFALCSPYVVAGARCCHAPNL